MPHAPCPEKPGFPPQSQESQTIALPLLLVGSAILAVVATRTPARQPPTLAEVYQVIKSKQFVDLTHAFAPGIPHWKGFPDETREKLYWYEPGVGKLGSGFWADLYCHVGQWGTHVDPPAHFIKGLRTVDEIELKETILPLIVIDVHEKVAKNPDYTLTVEDVRAWEAKHGPIPEGAFVAMRTDWSKRWSDKAAIANKDASETDCTRSGRLQHLATKPRIPIRELQRARATIR